MEDGVREQLARIEALLIIGSKEVFNVEEAAIFLGISKDRLYHLVSDKAVPYYKRGNSNYFKKTELESWMTAERIKTKQEIEEQAKSYITSH